MPWKRFQEENGLTADGVAGTKTLNAVAAAVARKGGTPASGGNAGTTLKLNSQGTKVSQLQTDLKQLGYYYADITGNFGERTEAAVKAFQKAKSLTADGIAGTKTLNAIAVAVDKAGGSSSGSSSTNMKLGSTGTAVSALQQNLTTLGYYYGDVTGHYGNLTQQAVQEIPEGERLDAGRRGQHGDAERDHQRAQERGCGRRPRHRGDDPARGRQGHGRH